MRPTFYACLLVTLLSVSCQTQTPIVTSSPTHRSGTIYLPEAQPSTLASSPPAMPVPRDYFSVGSSMDEVAALMGTPSRINNFLNDVWWYYGYSRVGFRAGRVTEWDNTSNNLKVRWSASSAPAQAPTSAPRQTPVASSVRSVRPLSLPGSVPRLGGGLYIGTGDGHWIQSKSDDGDIITLEDGSVWQVDLFDRIDTMLWLPVTEITVVESGGGYLLINTDDGEKAQATLLRQ